MPLVFTNPALLLGALTGVLPVIIHFLSRRRVQRRKFSDLRFLDEVQARQARSLGIRRWLLLLLRVLAILLVALAIAGPRWGGLVAAGSGQRSVLFVIDTSASMDTQQEDGTRLDEALAACAAMMASLSQRTTVQVIVAGSRTEPLFADWLPVGAGARQGLALVRQTDGLFDPAAVLREAAVQVARAPAAQVEMVWISDLQTPAEGRENETAARTLAEAGTVRHLVRRVGEPVPGGGVLGIDLPRRAVHEGEGVVLEATVTSRFDDETFVLELDGRPVAEAVVPRATASPTVATFALPVPGPGLHRGWVRRESDLFPGDDKRPFVLEVPGELDVLVAHGRDRSVDGIDGRGGWRFLAQALAPGGQEGLFRVTSLATDNLATGELSRYQVVVIVDPDPLGRRAQEGLLAWVAGGGSLLLLLGEPAQAGYYAGTLLPAVGLPGSAVYQGGDVRSPLQGRARILDPSHPVFHGLGSEALATLEDVPWQRWFRLEEGPGRVLMTLTDDSPLLIETNLEAGRVAILSCDLVRSGSSLATSPMALPFFQRLCFWLAGTGGRQAAVNTEAGHRAQVVPLQSEARDFLERSEELRILDSGDDAARPANLVWRGDTPYLVGDVIERAGFTVFLAGSDTVGLVAAAVPAAESTLDLLSDSQWGQLLAEWGLSLAADVPATRGDDLAAILSGRDLAPWFFFLAFCLLLLELWVGRGTTVPGAISG